MIGIFVVGWLTWQQKNFASKFSFFTSCQIPNFPELSFIRSCQRHRGDRTKTNINIKYYFPPSFFPSLLCQVKYLTKNYVKINIIFDLLSCHFYRVSYRVKNKWQKDLEKTNISLKYRLTFFFAIFIQSCRK